MPAATWAHLTQARGATIRAARARRPAPRASTSDASTSAKAKAAPQEDTTALDTGAGAKVTTFATSGGISVTAPAGFESTPTCRHLQDAVAAFTARGYHLGFAMVDLKTGRGASYNASQKFYPASSIKAVYVTAILESTHGGAASSSGAITKCLVDSDNDAFRTLLKTYGYNVYGSWLQSRAPEAAQEAYGYNYPHISATGMLNCWREVYRFGTSGEPGASLLTGCLARTNHSAWGALLRDRSCATALRCGPSRAGTPRTRAWPPRRLPTTASCFRTAATTRSRCFPTRPPTLAPCCRCWTR